MKKIISALLIAALAFVTLAQPMQVRAEDVTHLNKDDVKTAIDAVMPITGLGAIGEEELTRLAAPYPYCTPEEPEVTLASVGDDNKSTKLTLLDSTGNPISDVNWYVYLTMPPRLISAGESFGDDPIASISSDGTVQILREGTQSDSFYVWAEYNTAIYRFHINVLKAVDSRKELALKKIDEIIAENQWTQLTSREEQARAVYTFLINYVEYDWNFETKYGDYVASTIFDKKAVCNGYAKTYYAFMAKLGIPCEVVIGNVDTATSSPGRHAWNKIQMENGNWYYVDATYGDKIDSNGNQIAIDYSYFMQTLDEFNASHHIDTTTPNTVPDPGQGGGTPPDPGTGGGTTPDPGTGGGTTPDPGTGGGTTPDPGTGGGATPDPGTGGGTTPDPGTQTPSQPVTPSQPGDPQQPADSSQPVDSQQPVAPQPAAQTKAAKDTVDAPAAYTDVPRIISYEPNTEAIKKITSVKPGEIPNLKYCEGERKVTKDVFQSIAGKKSYFAFNMGNLWWMVDGRKITKDTKLRDLKLKVELDREGTSALVPEELTAPVRANASKVMKLRMQENGDFGFEMYLHILLGSEYADKNVKLLYLDPATDSLVEVSNGIANHGGIVLLPMTWGRGSFLLVVE